MSETETANSAHGKGRLLRRLAWVGVVGLAIGGAAAIMAYRSSRQVPEWYQPGGAASEEQAQSAENKLVGVQNWAASKHAYESAKQRNTVKVKEPSRELEIVFTQSEVNSLLGKWYGRFGTDRIEDMKLEEVVQKPMVKIQKGCLTVAGAVPSLDGRVVSLDVLPVVENGELELKLLRVRTGNLRLPEFSWSKLREMLQQGLSAMADKSGPKARFDGAGAANFDTVTAVLARQGIDTLVHRKTENVLFLPIISENSGLPVRLIGCELDDGIITLRTEPLDSASRTALLERLKKPVSLTPAMRSTP